MSHSVKSEHKMIKDQKISSLIENCGRALIEKGYSDVNIEKHYWIWKKISRYMEEHSIVTYSADVGNQYLETLPPDFHISYLRSFRRSVFIHRLSVLWSNKKGFVSISL